MTSTQRLVAKKLPKFTDEKYKQWDGDRVRKSQQFVDVIYGSFQT